MRQRLQSSPETASPHPSGTVGRLRPSRAFVDELQGAEIDLRRYSRYLCHDESSAKDLYQNTILRALERWECYRPGSNIRAWATTVMYRLFVAGLRSAASRERCLARYSERNTQTHRPPVVERGASLEFLDALLGSVPEGAREMILMLAQGYRYTEIADAFGLPVGTVKGRIHLARRRLRERYTRIQVEAVALHN